MYEDGIADVLLPPADGIDGQAVIEAWESFARAEELEAGVRELVEHLLSA